MRFGRRCRWRSMEIGCGAGDGCRNWGRGGAWGMEWLISRVPRRFMQRGELLDLLGRACWARARESIRGTAGPGRCPGTILYSSWLERSCFLRDGLDLFPLRLLWVKIC